MNTPVFAQSDPQSLIAWLNSIGSAGLAFIVLALMMGWLITKRESDAKDARLSKMEGERDEWKNLYLRRSEVVGDAVDLAKQRRP